MPKKFPINEQRQWLEWYESGRPEASIAEKAGCDVRTVKKGIERARLDRDMRAARTDLLKGALHKHQSALLEIFQEILSEIEVPPLNQSMPWKQPTVPVVLKVDSKIHYELLREHLKRDKVWEVLDQWKKAVTAYLEAKRSLAQKAADLLEEKTGYKLVDNPITPPFLYSYNTVDLFHRAAIYHALDMPDKNDLEQSITIASKYGEVKYKGTTLAKAPGMEDECRSDILNALRQLKASGKAENVVTTFRAVEELTARAKRIVEEISLLGLVPGQCRVCRRLDM